MIPPNDDSVACLWAGLVRSIPGLLSIALLVLSSTIVFLFFAGDVAIKGRMLFQLILGIVLVVRLTSILGRIIFAPGDARVRPLDLSDSVAKPLHQALVTLFTFIISGLLLLLFIRDLGALAADRFMDVNSSWYHSYSHFLLSGFSIENTDRKFITDGH